MAKYEEYVIKGVSDDFYDNVISEKEGRLVLRLARLRTETPGLFNKYLPPSNIEDDEDMGKMCLLVEADKNPPKELLEAAFEKYKSTVGLARAKDGKLTVVRKQGQGDPDKTFAAMEKHIDAAFIIQTENVKKVIDEQPFTIYGSDDDPVIVAFLGGTDFTSFERPKVIHSGEYNIAMDKLSPLIAKLMTVNDGDMEALFSDLVTDENGKGGDMGPKVRSLLPVGAYLILM